MYIVGGTVDRSQVHVHGVVCKGTAVRNTTQNVPLKCRTEHLISITPVSGSHKLQVCMMFVLTHFSDVRRDLLNIRINCRVNLKVLA